MASIPDVPWKRAQNQQRARRSEDQAAKQEGGRRQPASGSRWFAKGDVRANGFLLDDKYTDDASFSLTAKDWRKITAEALQTPPGLLPSMRISIKGAPKLRVFREEDALYLLAKAGIGED
jgi:hypothetical protein